MARRRRTSAADDLIELVARLPWWAGVGLALVLYLVLHGVAAQEVVISAVPGQRGDGIVRTLFKTLASYGQYLLPLLCLAGAAVSAWRRHQRKGLIADVEQSRASDALDGISWRAFEALVGEAFRLQGYRVMETGGGGADGGIDLVLTRGGEKFLVQCKQWKAFKVGVDVVRQLYGVMAARGATGGYVVTSGRFTVDAIAFAEGRNIKLIDGPQLHALIRQARGSKTVCLPTRAAPSPSVTRPTSSITALTSSETTEPPSGASPSHFVTAPSLSSPAPTHIATPATPSVVEASELPRCPVCSESMLKRIAKRGSNAGGVFWGCSSYPRCRGTRSVS